MGLVGVHTSDGHEAFVTGARGKSPKEDQPASNTPGRLNKPRRTMGNPISNVKFTLLYLTRDPDRARGPALSMSSLTSIETPCRLHQNGQKSP